MKRQACFYMKVCEYKDTRGKCTISEEGCSFLRPSLVNGRRPLFMLKAFKERLKGENNNTY